MKDLFKINDKVLLTPYVHHDLEVTEDDLASMKKEIAELEEKHKEARIN